jgi:tape measure domain-containing protein
MSTLEKLKRSLNLTGATKGLEDVSSAAKNCDMSVLGGAVETVKAKFSALQVMGITALTNITNSAVNAGKRIVSALTIDPIKMGFSEYETQINAVQTILANTESKGKTLDDVNKALDELNVYADKTIYNFTEMTRNIGTFTAAGVDLDTSVSAIKGIANLAAVSGSTSQQASTAMYQLSQAMASGTVKLMDWNSVVNAGMGGQVFQDALKETAKVHGIAIDDIIKKNGSFRESLSDGWLTTEILTETLSKFTGDLTEEQLKSMGYTEEQIEGILKMGKTANDAATKVKTFSQLFDTLKEAAQSGWTQTWEILVGDFEEAKELLTSVSDTIGEMIGSSAEARNEMLENWKVLGGRTALIDSVRNAFEGVMSIITPIKEAFREIFPPMTAEKLLGFTEGLRDLTAKFKLSDTASENLKRTFKGLFAVVDIFKQFILAAAKGVATMLGGVGKLGGGILGVTASFGDWLVALRDIISESDIFNKIFQTIAVVLKNVSKVVGAVVGFIGKKFVAPGFEFFGSLLLKIVDRLSSVGNAAGDMKSEVVDAFDSAGSFLENCSLFKFMEALWNSVKIIGSGLAKAFGALTGGLSKAFGNANLNGILDFVNSLIAGGLGISLINFLKSLKEPIEGVQGFLDNAKGILGGITEIFDGVKGCLEAYQNQLKAGTLMKIAQAIALLAAALFVLSLVDNDKMSSAITAMTTLFTELMVAMAIVTKMDKGSGLMKATGAILGLSTAMLVLSVSMKILSTMSWREMSSGLIATAGGLGVLVAAVKFLPEKNVKSAAASIKKMSTALLILSVALKIMGTMSWQEMGVGLVASAASLAVMVGAVNLLPEQKVTQAAKAIVKLSSALLILSVALKIMGTMSWQEMGVGLLTMAGGLAILVGAVNLLPADTALKAVGMITIAGAMIILAGALKIMGTMSWQEMGVGLAALAGSLAILAIALNLMIAALPGAAALIVAAGALAILTPVLLILGTMSWESIIKGLVAIAGAFTVIGVAGLLLTPIIPSILALGAAMLLIGTGTLAAATGLLLLGAALSSLAIGFTAVMASLSAIVTGIVALVSAVVTGIIKGIGDGIIALCEVIIQGAPAICEAFTVLIIALCDAIVASTPSLINTIDVLLTALLNFIVSFVPRLVVAGMKLIIGLLQGIAANIGGVISAAVDVIIAFVNGVASQIPKVIQAAINLMLKFINGLAEGIRSNTSKMLDAINNLLSAVFEAIGMAIGNIPESGRQIVQGLINGIKSSAGALFDTMVSVVKNAWDGVLKFLGIKSPSRLAMEAGEYTGEGFAVGLKQYANTVGEAAVGVGETAMSSLSESVKGISDAVSDNVNLQPTIRPVLDLSDVKSGANALNGMLDAESTVGISTNANAISNLLHGQNQNGANNDVIKAINDLRDNLGKIGNVSYTINGVTYNGDGDIAAAFETILRAAKIERRV